MIHSIAQTVDGDTIEQVFCCHQHAREACIENPEIIWWELFDLRGNMVDSADKFLEESE